MKSFKQSALKSGEGKIIDAKNLKWANEYLSVSQIHQNHIYKSLCLPLPIGVCGVISPYPTVVIVIKAHQIEAGIEVNFVPGICDSQK